MKAARRFVLVLVTAPDLDNGPLAAPLEPGTAARLVPRLERRVLAEHPYDTPEILTLPLDAGTARYLAWLGESVK